MPLIAPFKGLRPAEGRADDVVAPPYDVMNTAEAREMAQDRPWSFLHISRPEIDLPEYLRERLEISQRSGSKSPGRSTRPTTPARPAAKSQERAIVGNDAKKPAQVPEPAVEKDEAGSDSAGATPPPTKTPGKESGPSSDPAEPTKPATEQPAEKPEAAAPPADG